MPLSVMNFHMLEFIFLDIEQTEEGPQQFYDVEQPFDEWHNPEHHNRR